LIPGGQLDLLGVQCLQPGAQSWRGAGLKLGFKEHDLGVLLFSTYRSLVIINIMMIDHHAAAQAISYDE
jgi:hypothetical protein